jgi:hypothetical protein
VEIPAQGLAGEPRRDAGLWLGPANGRAGAVGGPTAEAGRATARPKLAGAWPRKAARGGERLPYCNPTQVGTARSRRRAGDGSLRNSATCPRNFGRRGPAARPRVAGAAKGPKRLFTTNTGPCEVARRGIGADACPVLEGQGAGCKPPTEAPVNGGRNYNGPKVAKFLVG